MLAKDTISEFIQKIYESFGDMVYPGDNNLVAGTMISHSDDELRIIRCMKGKRWQEISLDSLIETRDCISFFTAESYRYYLPAYMIAAIVHYHEIDVLSNNTLYSLVPPPDSDSWKESFLSRAEGFTREQTTVIQTFIELYARLDPFMLEADSERHLQRAAEFWEKPVAN